VNIFLIFGTPVRSEGRTFPTVNENACRDVVCNLPLSGTRLFTPPNERFVPLLRSLRQAAAGNSAAAQGFTLVSDIAQVRRPFRVVFIGGGLRELELFQSLHGLLPCFPVTSTGGATVDMLASASPSFSEMTARDLRGGVSYNTLWSRILNDYYPTITRAEVAPIVSEPPAVITAP
jgi:hypothetical protein